MPNELEIMPAEPSYDKEVINEHGFKVELSNKGDLPKENPIPKNPEGKDVECIVPACKEHIKKMSGVCEKHEKEFKKYKKHRKEKSFKNLPIEKRTRLDDQWGGLIHSNDWLGRIIPPGYDREKCRSDAPAHNKIIEILVQWMNKDRKRREKIMDDFISDVLKNIVANIPDATTLQKNIGQNIEGVMSPDGLISLIKKIVDRHFPKEDYDKVMLPGGEYKKNNVRKSLEGIPIRVVATLLILAFSCEESNRGDAWYYSFHNMSLKRSKRASAYMPTVYYLLRRYTNASDSQARACLRS